MTPPLQLGLGMGLARGGFINPVLLDLDFTAGFPSELTHSRASGATLVAADGRVTYGPEQWCIYTETFAESGTSWWRGVGCSKTAVSGGVATIREDSATTLRYYFDSLYTNCLGASFVTVMEVKADGRNYAAVGHANIGNSNVVVNLVTGAAETVLSAVVDHSITELEDGWWRVMVQSVSTSAFSGPQVNPCLNGTYGAYLGDPTKGILIRKPSHFRGTLADFPGYVSNTTGSEKFYARITHDPVTLVPLGHPYEPAATNLVANSHVFSISGSPGFTSSGSPTFASAAGTSPDGSSLAGKVGSSSGSSSFYRNVSAVSGSYTRSLYAKHVSGSSQIKIGFQSSGFTGSLFDLSGDGSVVSNDSGYVGKIEKLSNGWFRIQTTFTAASWNYETFQLPDVAEFLLWGSQVETGSVATSLIPTYGAAATRAADVINNLTVPQLAAANGFSLFVEFDATNNGARQTVGGIYSTTTSFQYSFDYARGVSNHYMVLRNDPLAANRDMLTTRLADREIMRAAATYTPSRRSFAYNATDTGSDTFDLSTPATNNANQFRMGTLNGVIRRIIVDDKVWSDAKIVSLTTPDP